jgi:hypothetical protein
MRGDQGMNTSTSTLVSRLIVPHNETMSDIEKVYPNGSLGTDRVSTRFFRRIHDISSNDYLLLFFLLFISSRMLMALT